MKTKTRTKAGAVYNNHNGRKVVVTPSVNPWSCIPRKVVVVMTDVTNPWTSARYSS
jgi:hypothetical protein